MPILDDLALRLGLKPAEPRKSPMFTLENTGAIAAGGSEIISFETTEGDQQKYYPFRNLEISNNDTASPVDILINGDGAHKFTVLNRSVSPWAGLWAYSVRIVNRGTASISAGDIKVTMWNE